MQKYHHSLKKLMNRKIVKMKKKVKLSSVFLRQKNNKLHLAFKMIIWNQNHLEEKISLMLIRKKKKNRSNKMRDSLLYIIRISEISLFRTHLLSTIQMDSKMDQRLNHQIIWIKIQVFLIKMCRKLWN